MKMEKLKNKAGISELENWDVFYFWLQEKGYDVVRTYNIFRGDKFICSFDPQEDSDSGEIEDVIKEIMNKDIFNFK